MGGKCLRGWGEDWVTDVQRPQGHQRPLSPEYSPIDTSNDAKMTATRAPTTPLLSLPPESNIAFRAPQPQNPSLLRASPIIDMEITNIRPIFFYLNVVITAAAAGDDNAQSSCSPHIALSTDCMTAIRSIPPVSLVGNQMVVSISPPELAVTL